MAIHHGVAAMSGFGFNRMPAWRLETRTAALVRRALAPGRLTGACAAVGGGTTGATAEAPDAASANTAPAGSHAKGAGGIKV